MNSDDPRLLAEFEKAVQAAVARQLSVQEAVANIASALAEPPREQLMTEVAQLEQQGRKRTAVGIVARRYESDPKRVESLERKLRDWRKKNGGSPFAAAKTG
jgi:hypothetical protein